MARRNYRQHFATSPSESKLFKLFREASRHCPSQYEGHPHETSQLEGTTDGRTVLEAIQGSCELLRAKILFFNAYGGRYVLPPLLREISCYFRCGYIICELPRDRTPRDPYIQPMTRPMGAAQRCGHTPTWLALCPGALGQFSRGRGRRPDGWLPRAQIEGHSRRLVLPSGGF